MRRALRTLQLVSIVLAAASVADSATTSASDQRFSSETSSERAARLALEADYRAAQQRAALDYARCLQELGPGSNFGRCDEHKSAFLEFVPALMQAGSLACIEEGVIGSARSNKTTCDAYRARYSRRANVGGRWQ